MKYLIGAIAIVIIYAVSVTFYDWWTCDGVWGGTFPMACERSGPVE